MGLGLDGSGVIRSDIRNLDLFALARTSDACSRPAVYTCEGDDSCANRRDSTAEAAEPRENHHASPIGGLDRIAFCSIAHRTFDHIERLRALRNSGGDLVPTA